MLRITIFFLIILIVFTKNHKLNLNEDDQCLNQKCGVQINECYDDYECFESIEKCAPTENPTPNDITEAINCVKDRSVAAEELLNCALKKCVKKELSRKQLKLIRKFMNK